MRGGYSKRISLNENPNVNKKMCVGGGGWGMRGWGRVRLGLEKVFFFFYMNPNLNSSWRVEEEGVGYG